MLKRPQSPLFPSVVLIQPDIARTGGGEMVSGGVLPVARFGLCTTPRRVFIEAEATMDGAGAKE